MLIHTFPFPGFKNSSPERRKILFNNNRVATAVIATAAMSLALLPVAQAADVSTARACVDADNVWVHLDFGIESDKSPAGGCATEFTDGLVALQSAGFDVEYDEGGFGAFITGIEGVTPIWEENQTYWSYWSGEVAEDYSVTYEYSQVGASSARPAPGSVEAWVVTDSWGDEGEPSLIELPEPPVEEEPEVPTPPAGDDVSGSSDNVEFFAVIAGILALVGGGLAALFSIPGFSIPGFVLPKF